MDRNVAQHYKTEIRLNSGAEELIKFLYEQNVKMAIGTSNTKHLAETVLKANNVLQYFDSIVAGCEEIKGKPYPDIFLSAAVELKVNPADCLVIEDTLHGVRAAHNGGMDTFAIFDDNDTHDIEKLKSEAEFYAENFWEIIKKLTTN